MNFIFILFLNLKSFLERKQIKNCFRKWGRSRWWQSLCKTNKL